MLPSLPKRYHSLWSQRRSGPCVIVIISSRNYRKMTEEKSQSEELQDNVKRKVVLDKYVPKSISNVNYQYTVFTRLNAVSSKKNLIRFENVRFDHCVFDGCYIRDCSFDSCSFVGARFVNSNFHGSSFSGCKFDYAIFDKTQVDVDILHGEAPQEENLKMRFARTLRMNFQQLGDAQAVNRAISLELRATEIHLFKSWASNETYYREKYPGIIKIGKFLQWLQFRLLDLIWGNGESIFKLLITTLFLIFVVAVIDAVAYKDPYNLREFFDSAKASPAIFFGILQKIEYPYFYSALIVVGRLTLFSLFTAILIKRFSRR